MEKKMRGNEFVCCFVRREKRKFLSGVQAFSIQADTKFVSPK